MRHLPPVPAEQIVLPDYNPLHHACEKRVKAALRASGVNVTGATPVARRCCLVESPVGFRRTLNDLPNRLTAATQSAWI